MKKNKIIYWTTTGLIALMMFFSAYQYLANPQMEQAFKQMGFPNFFRIELAFAKIIGALVLLIPAIPTKFKEWAFAGFFIVFISAFLAHLTNGDAAAMVISPLIFLAVLIVSNLYLHKVNTAKILR